MSIKVHFDTFAALAGAEPTEYGSLRGTVRASVAGKPELVDCWLDRDGSISLRGFVGRYVTSTKPWRASVTCSPDGAMFVHFGRDDRSGRFNKSRMIRYDPETYNSI